MREFNWSKAFGFGLLTWGIMAVALWILGSILSLSPLWAHGIVAIVGAVSVFLFARNIEPVDGMQAAAYGLTFAAVVLVLDLAVTQWLDVHTFTFWPYWAGAAAVLLAPWVETQTQPAFTQRAI